jgi:hypothetical protein
MLWHGPSGKLLSDGIVEASVIRANQRIKVHRNRRLNRSGRWIWRAGGIGRRWAIMVVFSHARERKVSSCCDCRNAKRCTANDRWSHICTVPECPPEYRVELAIAFRTNRLAPW